MRKRAKKAENRLAEILAYLKINGNASTNDLKEYFGCSESTIRNDLRYLQETGQIQRTFGGAMLVERTTATLSEREKINVDKKRALAKYICENVLEADDSILIDAGSTLGILAQEITEAGLHLNVISNSLLVALQFQKNENVQFFLAAGKYNAKLNAFDDSEATNYLSKMYVKKLFLAANGITVGRGVTVAADAETYTKQVMLKQAERVFLVLDSGKIGRDGMKHLCDIDAIDVLVTNADADQTVIEKLRECGTEVILVP